MCLQAKLWFNVKLILTSATFFSICSCKQVYFNYFHWVLPFSLFLTILGFSLKKTILGLKAIRHFYVDKNILIYILGWYFKYKYLLILLFSYFKIIHTKPNELYNNVTKKKKTNKLIIPELDSTHAKGL